MAKQVLQQTEHTIDVEGFRLRVQVQPLELPMLTTIQVTEWQGPGICTGPHAPGHKGVGCGWDDSLLPPPRCPAR